MANTRLLFLEQNGEVKHLECYNFGKRITILIESEDGNDAHIFLDKNTAIKLSKTLKTEISKIGHNE